MLGAWIDRYWIWGMLAGAMGAFASVPGQTSTVGVAAKLMPRPRAPWVILPGEPVLGLSLNDTAGIVRIIWPDNQPILSCGSCNPQSVFISDAELAQTSLNHFDLLDRTEIAGDSTIVADNQAAWNDLSLETN